jgi:hypothetical protein
MGCDIPEDSIIDFFGQLNYVNNCTDFGSGGILGIALLLIIFGVTFILSKAFGWERSFVTSGFITAFSALLLAGLNIVNSKTLTATIIIFVVGLFIMWRSAEREGV